MIVLSCRDPYNLPLKHADWVQKELDTLEKAGVITRSVSPLANPIVIVPKKTEPGEPPRRRLCVDYRAINKLLPAVKKVGSNAKGVLTLVPLPKIDEIYAKLKGYSVYSTFDMRSGYYHVGLSAESHDKYQKPHVLVAKLFTIFIYKDPAQGLMLLAG